MVLRPASSLSGKAACHAGDLTRAHQPGPAPALGQRALGPGSGAPRAASQRTQNSGNAELFPLVVIAGVVTVVPLIALFLILQRYWRSGLLLGSLAN